jgi:ABC-type uncharacterized transport system permease subunit
LVGKLSDASGLVVAPVLVACVVHWAMRRRLTNRLRITLANLAAVAAIAIPFVLCKLFPVVANQFASWLHSFGRPAYVVSDVTDLIVLPFAGLTFAILTKTSHRPSQ